VNKFFSKTHPLSIDRKIEHVVATGADLIKLVFSTSPEDLKHTVILIDEVDSFIQGDRLRAYHIGDLSPHSKTDDESTYVVDLLDLIFRYKFVIGFCAHVDESINRILIAKQEALEKDGGPLRKRIYTFNFGNIRGDGVSVI
jgi:hypothetical protein